MTAEIELVSRERQHKLNQAAVAVGMAQFKCVTAGFKDFAGTTVGRPYPQQAAIPSDHGIRPAAVSYLGQVSGRKVRQPVWC